MTATDFEPTSLLLAGRPGTGKTSFLALLYVSIMGGRTPNLELGSFQDDREYLNRISRNLLRCEPAKHTEVAEQNQLSLSLLVGPNRMRTMLQIPDTSGETWDTALTERQWSADLDQRVDAASAVIVFVHPGKNAFNAGATITEANAAAAALGSGAAAPEHSPAPRLPHEHSPTQVELVDLLQMLREDRGGRPARACVVISAYDLAPADMAPGDWLRQNCPLVAQYLDVSSTWLEVAVFGISAQGGRFDEADDRAQLETQDAVDRAIILSEDGSPGALEDTILWALNGQR